MSNKGQLNLWDHLRHILFTFCHKYVLGSETLWYMYCHNSAWLSTACNHRVHDEKLIYIFDGASIAVTYLHIHTDNIFKGNFFTGNNFIMSWWWGDVTRRCMIQGFLCLISIMHQRNGSGVFHHEETVIASKYASLVGHKLHFHFSHKLIPVSGHSHQISPLCTLFSLREFQCRKRL